MKHFIKVEMSVALLGIFTESQFKGFRMNGNGHIIIEVEF